MNILLAPFQYDFFVRALFLGTLMGVVCGLLGIFIVMRREALMSHALANTAFLGVALGLLWGINLHWSMCVCTVLSAGIISGLQYYRSLPEDSLLEFVAQVTFAIAVVCISFLSGYRTDLFQYLFGDILGISSQDMWVQVPLLLLLLVSFLFLKRTLLQMTLSRELAVGKGVPILLYNTLFLVLVALVVAMGIKVIGVILISASLVLPANTSRLWATNFRDMQWGAVVTGFLGSVLGLFLSFYLNVPSGASIVLTLSGFLFLALIGKKIRSRCT